MDGVPLFSLWKYALPHAKLLKLRGCLNSTTTMILTRMEGRLDKLDKVMGERMPSGLNGSSNNCNESCESNAHEHRGESFDEALTAAKQMGIVEEDESLDVDGYDAAAKLRALLVVLTRSHSNIDIPSIEDIPKDSIRKVTWEDIRRAYLDGRKRYRLVASAELVSSPLPDTKFTQHMNRIRDTSPSQHPTTEKTSSSSTTTKSNHNNRSNTPPMKTSVKKTWKASVQLELIPPSDTLYNLSGTSSSIEICTDVLGPVTVVSTDPTLVDTAYGLFSDIVRVAS